MSTWSYLVLVLVVLGFCVGRAILDTWPAIDYEDEEEDEYDKPFTFFV